MQPVDSEKVGILYFLLGKCPAMCHCLTQHSSMRLPESISNMADCVIR
jgi:hypothetical protein